MHQTNADTIRTLWSYFIFICSFFIRLCRNLVIVLLLFEMETISDIFVVTSSRTTMALGHVFRSEISTRAAVTVIYYVSGISVDTTSSTAVMEASLCLSRSLSRCRVLTMTLRKRSSCRGPFRQVFLTADHQCYSLRWCISPPVHFGFIPCFSNILL